MNVMVTSAYPRREPIGTFLEYARADRFRQHKLTDEPENADVILFIEHVPSVSDWFYGNLRRHPLVNAYREKCFMYNEMDEPWACLPGVYTCLPMRQFDSSRHRAGPYLVVQNHEIGHRQPDAVDPNLLFSFMGARTHSVRDRILAIDHPRSVTVDTSALFHRWNNRNLSAMKHYEELLAASKFVLCPRGIGTASFRLFETMQMGRVPVIVADQWVAPTGPAWDTCSMRVNEKDIVRIPKVLEARERDWPELAKNARAAWEEWFAPDVIFHRMVEWCAQILEERRRPEAIAQRLPNIHYIGRHARHAIRPVLRVARSLQQS